MKFSFSLFPVTGILLLAFFQPLDLCAADLRLAELDLSLIKQGWGFAHKDQSVAGLPLKMGGVAFTNGVGTHAPAEAAIQLDEKATHFSAMVGLSDSGRNEPGSVDFQVYGDDKLLAHSGVMHGGDAAKALAVPLAGVRRLRLVVTDGGDGMNSDHANWGDAVITYAGARPRLVDPNALAAYEPVELYPPVDKLVASPGDTTYFVDPSKGNDASTGKSVAMAWKSIAKVNALKLAPGDKVVITSGLHQATLKPTAQGTAAKPVIIEFLPGTHEFAGETALRRPWYISNSCDSPAPKPVGIFVENSKHLRLQGGGVDGDGKTLILMGGRMMHLINNHAEDITYTKLVFDLKRPSVSEYRVMEVEANSVIIQVAESSTYEIKNGKFAWTGDIVPLRSSSDVNPDWVMVQEAIPETGKCWRRGQWDPFSPATAENLGSGKVKLTYEKGNCGMTKGHQFQFRHIFRDSAGGFNNRSKDLVFRDCDFYALVSMAIVSQFTENITYQRVRFAPPKGTIRTCPCACDAIHFSGCKGNILVDSCIFSGLNDDPINVHGTHLRIIEKVTENQLHLRFMQSQSYGFAAFAPGDEIAVTNHDNLRELPGNPRRKVTAIAPMPGDKTGKEWLLTLDGPVPDFGKHDVVDNITWNPNFTARSNYVTMDSCRGFLITTRGKVLVEDNTFNRCAMAGILVEDDANGWFESGPVRDMIIRNNRFIGCNIEINPQTASGDPKEPVHENIRIVGNSFDGGGISAKSVKGLEVTGNKTPAGVKVSASIAPSCSDVKAD